jgi:hypothetical protein
LLGLARASAGWGDFDGDGDLDLAMTGLTTSGVPTTHLPQRRRDVHRSSRGFLGVFAGGVAWGDFDGDGDLDLVVTGVTGASAGSGATRLSQRQRRVHVSGTSVPGRYLGPVRGSTSTVTAIRT